MLNLKNIDLSTDEKNPNKEIKNIKSYLYQLYNELEYRLGLKEESVTVEQVDTKWGEITGTLSDQSDLNNRLTSIETDLDTAESDIDDLETEMTGKVSKSGDTMTGTLIISAGTPLEYIQSGTTIDMTISSSDWSSLTTWYEAN